MLRSGKTANRMQVISIYDLSFHEAAQAFKRLQYKAGHPLVSNETVKHVLDYVGGRLAYLSRVSRAKDPVAMVEHILHNEKAWLLSQIGLIPDCDDDVMDEVSLYSHRTPINLVTDMQTIFKFSKNGAAAAGC